MNHEHYRDWIHLAIAEELGDAESRMLRDHLVECEACRAELEELSSLIKTIGAGGVAEPTERMLWEARRNLSESLRREPSISSVLGRVAQRVAPAGSGVSSPRPSRPSMWFTGWRVAFTGLAGALAGFFVAFMVIGAPTPQQPAPSQTVGTDFADANREMGPPAIANVRFVNTSPRNDVMEVEYDVVRPVRLRAPVTDEHVQRLLAYALVNESNTSQQLRAINALDKLVDQPSADPRIQTALIETLKSDANPAVRKQAIRVLGGMPFGDDIRDACLYVLENDTNAALRIAAINLLAGATLKGYEPGEKLYDVLKSDESDYIRSHTAAFIQEVNDDVQ